MPTRRSFVLLLTAFLFYLLANQTQVGWLYVVAAMLAGVVPAGWWLGRSGLRRLTAARQVRAGAQPDLHEGDEASVHLALQLPGRGWWSSPAALLRLTESCPLAAPDHPAQALPIFVPGIPAGGEVQLAYDVLIDRRGLHQFPPLRVESRAPFGLFRRRRRLEIPTRVLVYPEVRPLARLEMLDIRPLAEQVRLHSGRSSEVMGVRPYRTGDSPRHIHWRSVARRQQLMTKEFAEEAQPGLTLALDVFAHPYPAPAGKHTPFEWGVKLAASIGEYAHRRRYPLHLAADSSALPAPAGPVSWPVLLDYLARIQPAGRRTLVDLLAMPRLPTFLAVILPWPNDDVAALLALRQRQRAGLLAVLLDPASFPAGGPSAAPLAAELGAAGVPTRLVRFDPAGGWAEQL